MVDFVFNIRNELRTFDFCTREPDSETLTSNTRELVGQGDSIQKQPGPEAEPDPAGGVGGRSHSQKREVTSYFFDTRYMCVCIYTVCVCKYLGFWVYIYIF